MQQRIIFVASPEWRRLAGRLASIIEDPSFVLIKRNSRTTAGFFSHDGRELFVKRIESPGLLKGWLMRGLGSRAARAMRGSQILAEAGFACPTPLLMVEERRGGAVWASYIVTEALHDARIFSLLALPRARDLLLRRAIAKRAADEIRRLHDAGIYTRDLQETNLMIEERDGAPIIYFVDLEDVRYARRVSLRHRMLNLVHLDRSIGRFASRAKRLNFFYNYWGGKPSHEAARRLLRQYMRVRAQVDRRAGTSYSEPDRISTMKWRDEQVVSRVREKR